MFYRSNFKTQDYKASKGKHGGTFSGHWRKQRFLRILRTLTRKDKGNKLDFIKPVELVLIERHSYKNRQVANWKKTFAIHISAKKTL